MRKCPQRFSRSSDIIAVITQCTFPQICDELCLKYFWQCTTRVYITKCFSRLLLSATILLIQKSIILNCLCNSILLKLVKARKRSAVIWSLINVYIFIFFSGCPHAEYALRYKSCSYFRDFFILTFQIFENSSWYSKFKQFDSLFICPKHAETFECVNMIKSHISKLHVCAKKFDQLSYQVS